MTTQFDGIARLKAALIAVLALSLSSCWMAQAQTTQSAQLPAKSSTAAKPQGPIKTFTNKDIATRPYSTAIPKPIYPTSPQEQKKFTVNYIYNYSQVLYTPPVQLPKTSDTSRDTPEAAVATFFSAMLAGDYDAWLQCWDESSRADFVKDSTEKQQGASYWRAIWQKGFTGKRLMLVDRIEMVGYVLLDIQVVDPMNPAKNFPNSALLKNIGGKWLVTNELSDDQMLANFGVGVNKTTLEFNLAPLRQLTGGATQQGEAQRAFLKSHLKTAEIDTVAR